MKFTLTTDKYFYPEKEEREKLEKLGFTFKPSDYYEFCVTNHQPTIEINSLEELVALAEEYGDLIFGPGRIDIDYSL
jgi:hypothetical protein